MRREKIENLNLKYWRISIAFKKKKKWWRERFHGEDCFCDKDKRALKRDKFTILRFLFHLPSERRHTAIFSAKNHSSFIPFPSIQFRDRTFLVSERIRKTRRGPVKKISPKM